MFFSLSLKIEFSPIFQNNIAKEDYVLIETRCDNKFLHFAPTEDEFLVVENAKHNKPSLPSEPSQSWIKQALCDPTTITNPICNDCLDSLDQVMDERRISTMTEVLELRRYIVDNGKRINSNESEQLRCELKQLTIEEQDLVLLIRNYDNKISNISELSKLLLSEQQTVNDIHNQLVSKTHFWDEQCREVNAEMNSLTNAIHAVNARLVRLQKRSLLENAFRIETDGPIGKINGFRLGVDFGEQITGSWNETNCAWGQIVLLLNSMSHYNGIAITDFELIAYGSRSTINVKHSEHSYLLFRDKTPQSLQLYCHSFGVPNVNFERALTALLNCLRKIETYMLREYPEFQLPNTFHWYGIMDNETDTFYTIT